MTRRASNQDASTRRGRPALASDVVDDVGGASAIAAARLQVILATVAGSMTVDAACAALGVGRSRFHAMRRAFLEQAAGLLEPRARGPHPQAPSAADVEADRLRQENARLVLELKAMQVREELALAMPRLFAAGNGRAREQKGGVKKGAARRRR